MKQYYLKVSGSTRETNQTINIKASYNTLYVSVCWLGVITDDSNTCIADDIQTYCESVYIGPRGCAESKQSITGSIDWHGCIITYSITQEDDPNCKPCDKDVPDCEFIEAYALPYIIPYAQSSTSEVHYSYWDYEVNSDCEIVRTRVDKSIPIEFYESATTIPCSAETRIISSSFTLDCGGEMGFDFYVQMPDNCCDTPSGICYEIGEVYYINSAGTLITDVSPSGETIYFYFDYKKNETDDKCNTKTTYGRFDSKQQNIPWVISGCVDSECCSGSVISSAFTWANHTSCKGNDNIVIPLEIIRRKDINYSGDCEPSCSANTTYCVDMDSIKSYYKAGDSWSAITENYIFPYYGGSMKTSWDYSAFTIYDDCTSGFTSGNTWDDIVDILPYSGDCGDGNVEGEVKYKFKEGDSGCTEFSVTYRQNKKSCGDECGSCIEPLYFDITNTTGETDFTSNIINGCEVEVVSNPEWITATTSDTQVTFSLAANSGSTREGGVTFKLNDKECYDTVIITQSGSSQDSSGDTPDTGDTPVEKCSCSGSTFVMMPISKISSDGGSHVRIASYIFDDCITAITSGTGVTYVMTCDESSFSIEGCDDETLVSFGYGTQEKKPLIPDFVASDSVTFEDDGFVYADVEPNPQPFERTGYVAISHSASSEDCGSIQVPVTQEKGKCSSYLSVDGSVCNDVGGSLTIKIENG